MVIDVHDRRTEEQFVAGSSSRLRETLSSRQIRDQNYCHGSCTIKRIPHQSKILERKSPPPKIPQGNLLQLMSTALPRKFEDSEEAVKMAQKVIANDNGWTQVLDNKQSFENKSIVEALEPFRQTSLHFARRHSPTSCNACTEYPELYSFAGH